MIVETDIAKTGDQWCNKVSLLMTSGYCQELDVTSDTNENQGSYYAKIIGMLII